MTPLKIIDIAFLPADSISSCNLLLAVKNKAACKCLFDKSFLNAVDFRTLIIEEVIPHQYQILKLFYNEKYYELLPCFIFSYF